MSTLLRRSWSTVWMIFCLVICSRQQRVEGSGSIKVADFGLAKDIYTSEYYRSEQRGALPVKWMSPESLLVNYFDEKTDVWSYGVTCWEIFSLGRVPYPGVGNNNVIVMIKAGKRLDKPVLCPDKLFTLMQTTWADTPTKRPTFEEIVDTLEQSILS
ncbi:fibroblast growth factor receptor 2-like [Dysidea avara]|uniref:fibroblast growth factor receptor 2-like n=1 Tax=Dysidea avara TaxID=196820 RepID=UPI003330395C